MVINTKVKQMRDVIIKYADENNIPVYDFYAVAGGNNASKQWAANDSDVYMKIKYSCIGKKYRPQKITVQIGNQKKVFRYRDYDA